MASNNISPSSGNSNPSLSPLPDLFAPTPSPAVLPSAVSQPRPTVEKAPSLHDICDDTHTFSPKASSTPTEFQPRATLDPRALLNPKGYQATAPASPHGPRVPLSASNSPAPLEFQFSTPTYTQSHFDIPNAQAGPVETNEQFQAQPNGFGGMIERVNNVEQRTHVPQSKRRRVEAVDNKSALQHHGGVGSGMIGQYVKERRDEAASQTPSKRVETVDLTDAGLLLSYSFFPCFPTQCFQCTWRLT